MRQVANLVKAAMAAEVIGFERCIRSKFYFYRKGYQDEGSFLSNDTPCHLRVAINRLPDHDANTDGAPR
jgi:hypothetical protein